MSNKTWLIGGAVAALLLAAYKTSGISKSLDYLQYQIAGLKFKFTNILSPEIIFTIAVTNPNTTAIPVEKFFGSIKNAGSLVANFSSLSPISLQGGEVANIDVSAKLNTVSVAMQLLQGNKIKSLTIDGLIKTGYYDQPFTKDVAVPALLGSVDSDDAINGWFKKLLKVHKIFHHPASLLLKRKKKKTRRVPDFLQSGFHPPMAIKGTYN